jgi:hypothetical protein
MADETPKSARPKVQTQDDKKAQAREDALSPDQKHQNYLETLDRLHAESVVGPDGKTPSTG